MARPRRSIAEVQESTPTRMFQNNTTPRELTFPLKLLFLSP
jgi:hypothetical protein